MHLSEASPSATETDFLTDPLAASEALAGIPGLTVKPREPLAAHTTMGTGGPAACFVVVDRRDAMEPLVAALRGGGFRWMMLGGGSNTLFDDRGFDGVVVQPGRELRLIEEGPAPDLVVAGAGAILSAAMNFARKRRLAGLEFAVGIPGMLGGALAGNAGAGAGDVCSLVESVDVIDARGERLVRRRGEFDFAYRRSALRDDVILGATLRLSPDTPEAIEARVQANLAKRWEQPVGSRSSGCMFKNPPGDFAGRVIDRSGLKGLRVGGVAVAEKHANFMVNDAGATTADVLALMEEVRRRVAEISGVELDAEVRVVPFRA